MTNANTLNQVERACAQLRREGHTVTFTAVATRAGLGRSSLYRDPTIRAVIEQHRHQTADSGTLTGLTDEIATLRTTLDALAAKVRHHDEQLRRLTARKG
jgi:ligand-binding SRPBCC domain-containing protein